ncbi:RecBCD enzyme subunit RecD [Marinicella pacifica]|uniref:RecBCD enzyme subunit RecD n=1 Tax=Marinicella pacifica TaxID=1171543 RepID=A0A917FR47_9GAMM|nr:exodeoxyribonuclease V subunit alpha [Marinicella pacifica]GGF96022.1 RecBCD enzyme subunit RecD [Marinicella pacifica]
MSLFDINQSFLQQCFPGLDLDYVLLSEQLNLDLAHLQLLRDCYQSWQQPSLPSEFWLYALLLVDEINRGSSCLNRSSERFKHYQQQFNLTDWQDLVIDLDLLKLAEQPVFVDHNGCLFFQKYHDAEQRLQQQISALIHDYQGQRYQPTAIKQALQSALTNRQYPLNTEQIQAVITGLMQSFSLVSGGPGTGKTTMVVSLLRCLQALGVDPAYMALAAPTGRAAYRMTASLQSGLHEELNKQVNDKPSPLMALEAQTIHRLIGKSHRFNQTNRYHSQHKLPYKVIIIDEVSMVDLQLMTELLDAVAPDCRLILVGDQFQLPSVESGAVLADLMPPQGHNVRLSRTFASVLAALMTPYVEDTLHITAESDDNQSGLLVDTCTILRQSHRSIQSIQTISEYVRLGDAEGLFKAPELVKLPQKSLTDSSQEGVIWMPQHNHASAGLALIWDWFKQHIELDQYHQSLQPCVNFEAQAIGDYQTNLSTIFDYINQQQILTLMNTGSAGQEFINRYLCQQLKQRWQINVGQNHFHGQAVMMRRNDYDKQLFNGDIGIILQADEGWHVVFPGRNGYRSYALALLPELITAFAITVHKSQGSEYRHVFMPLPHDPGNRLLSREIIYTGLTRAKKSAFIYGHQSVLSQAINNHNERQSGLQFW